MLDFKGNIMNLTLKEYYKSNGLKQMTLYCPVVASQTFNRLALACQTCDLLVDPMQDIRSKYW
jgi:hypothetical protein